MWCGDNECDQLYADMGLMPSANSLTRQVLKEVVARNDPGRAYLPGSPYISDEALEKGRRSGRFDAFLPENHIWGARDYFKASFYRDNTAHFISETGYHGCPSPTSVRR
ncbi:MAG: glycoside hydrolase family 2, partial [Clostridia bacterium]|nr:glycoside hydrolase family 2 [Clostridia bacterium]